MNSNDISEKTDKDTTVIIFTANKTGGIVQLALELYRHLIHTERLKAYCIMPNIVNIHELDKTDNNIILYEYKVSNNKCQTINSLIRPLKFQGNELLDIIISLQPDYFWSVDDQMLSNNIIRYLNRNTKIFTITTIHDVEMHPTETAGKKNAFLQKLYLFHRSLSLKTTDAVILLSDESQKKYSIKYSKYTNKCCVLPLGAHIPSMNESKLTEIESSNIPFYLFFGRFDKYKGIDVLLEIFEKTEASDTKLVIAGDGLISETLLKKAMLMNNVILIKRYISDEEMVWLFKNAKAAILPYHEASQSGIIPISYFFSTPVLVSDVPGLTQFVEDRKTGYICHDVNEYLNAIIDIENREKRNIMCKNAHDYYYRYLDWDKGIAKIFSFLGEQKS